MQAQELEAFFHRNIPMTRFMEIHVDRCNQDELVISAPMAPNANHHGTAFGGSIATLAVVCGWGALHLKSQAENLQFELVIQKSEMTYLKGIERDLRARCALPSGASWTRFTDTLSRKGRARLEQQVEVLGGEVVAARLTASYAARIQG